jgi:hypothetical protein
MGSRGTSRIPPNDLLVGALGEEVSAAPVTAASHPTIGMADDGSSSVIELARDVAAARREVVDHLAPVIVPRDEGGRIGHWLALELVDERCQPSRVGRPLRCASGAECERERGYNVPDSHVASLSEADRRAEAQAASAQRRKADAEAIEGHGFPVLDGVEAVAHEPEYERASEPTEERRGLSVQVNGEIDADPDLRRAARVLMWSPQCASEQDSRRAACGRTEYGQRDARPSALGHLERT